MYPVHSIFNVYRVNGSFGDFYAKWRSFGYRLIKRTPANCIRVHVAETIIRMEIRSGENRSTPVT